MLLVNEHLRSRTSAIAASRRFFKKGWIKWPIPLALSINPTQWLTAVMGLLDSPPAQIGGQVHYRDTELLNATPTEIRSIRGDRVSMDFQDAITALTPGLSIGYQISEIFRVHCAGQSPELLTLNGGHSAACFSPTEMTLAL